MGTDATSLSSRLRGPSAFSADLRPPLGATTGGLRQKTRVRGRAPAAKSGGPGRARLTAQDPGKRGAPRSSRKLEKSPTWSAGGALTCTGLP